LAIIQIAVVAVAAGAAGRLQRTNVSGTVVTGTDSRTGSVAGRPAGSGGAGAVGLLVYRTVVALGAVVLVGLPVASLISGSLRVGDGYGLAHYRALGQRVDVLPVTGLEALSLSVLFAGVAAVVAVAVGLPASRLASDGTRLGGLVRATLALPIGVSAVTLGFGYVVGLTLFDLRQWVGLIPLAHAVIGLPFVVAGLVVARRGIDPSLREVAATLGASPRQVRRSIDGPLIRPALLTGAGFSAAVSLGEFGATSFLGRTDGSYTAPLAIFRLLSSPGAQLRGQALALSVVVGGLVAAVALVLETRAAAHGARP
jgi:thiamine transport system permease protein